MTICSISEVLPLLTDALSNQRGFVKLPFVKDSNKGAVWVRFTKTLKIFAKKGTVCVGCGAEGTHFEHSLEFGLVLFTNKNGKKVKMTRDHIIPKSLGGTDMFDNLQVMCEECNCRKADNVSPDAVHFINLSLFFNRWLSVLPNDERQKTLSIKREILKDRWTSEKHESPGNIAFHEIENFLRDYGLSPPIHIIEGFRIKA
ncbi:MAG: HNH endonuclease [Candidatus Nitrosotenuis sp.]